MTSRGVRSRVWMFTQHGTATHIPKTKPEDWLGDKYRWVKYSLECGYKNKELHYQGYVVLTTSRTKSWCINRSEKHAPRNRGYNQVDWKPRRGTHKQAKHYVSKPTAGCKCKVCEKENEYPTHVDGPWKFGIEPSQGHRTDWDNLRDVIKDGGTLFDIDKLDARKAIICHAGIDKMMLRYESPRLWKTQVCVIYGPAGVGKNLFVEKLHARRLIYEKVYFLS